MAGSLSLCNNMPRDASSGPPALAASAVYSATLVRSTCGTKYSGSALSSTLTRMSSSDSSSANQGHQVAYQFRSDQVHRRRVDHDTQHTLVAPGDAQRAVGLGHRRLLHPGRGVD